MIAGPKPTLTRLTLTEPAAESCSIRQSTRGCTLSRVCRRVAIAWKTVRLMAQTEITTGSQIRKVSAQSFQRDRLPGSIADPPVTPARGCHEPCCRSSRRNGTIHAIRGAGIGDPGFRLRGFGRIWG